MKYLFCFVNKKQATTAKVEKKKIERGIQVVVKWDEPDSPTITYEARFDFEGGASYRVKFNSSLWASFNETDENLVHEFRQALIELSAKRHQVEHEETQRMNKKNNEAAAKFFRGKGLPY